LTRSSRAGSTGEQILLARLVQGLVDGSLLGALLRAYGLLAGLLRQGRGRFPAFLGRFRGAGELGLTRGLQYRLPFALRALPGESAQRRARGARQRDRLEHGQAVRDGVRAEHAHRGRHRALGAHAQSEGGHELGDVHAQQQIARRDLAAAQIREDHRAGTIHQNRVAREPAVRDAPGLERLHLVPGVAQQIVGDQLVGQGVQGVRAGVLVDEHHGVRAQLGGRDQLGRVGAGRDGRVGEEGFLLQGLAQ
jgi:hypothetical protein